MFVQLHIGFVCRRDDNKHDVYNTGFVEERRNGIRSCLKYHIYGIRLVNITYRILIVNTILDISCAHARFYQT